MVFTRTEECARGNNQTMISSNSQTDYSEDNTQTQKQVSEGPHLKRLPKLKLMYESEMESYLEFITPRFDCGEDSETVEETLIENTIFQFNNSSTKHHNLTQKLYARI